MFPNMDCIVVLSKSHRRRGDVLSGANAGWQTVQATFSNARDRRIRASTLSMVIQLFLRCFLFAQDLPSQFLRLFVEFFEFFSKTHARARGRCLVFLQTELGLTL